MEVAENEEHQYGSEDKKNKQDGNEMLNKLM